MSLSSQFYGQRAGLFQVSSNTVCETQGAVLDGGIVCLDDSGESHFKSIMYRRGERYFYAFDILRWNGKDLRSMPLDARKRTLKRLIPKQPSALLYVDHIEPHGERLFHLACREDLEGIVAKWKDGRYDPTRPTSWIKIKNAAYTQIVGRERLFEKRKPLAAAIQCRNPKLNFRSKFLKSEVLTHEGRLRSFETERA